MSIPFLFLLKCDIFLMVEGIMIENTLGEMLKKYVSIFINEYHSLLSKEQLETLKELNYNNIINFDNLEVPFGKVYFGKIYLSEISCDLINNLHNMEGFNSHKYDLNNKDISSYLQYMCDNGYSLLEYLGDILMYFVFDMVIKDKNGFINGLINQEIKYLKIKYSIRSANLYAKEEKVVSKITPIFKLETLRKIMFMDRPTAFKYLNDNYGFRFAKLIDDIISLMDNQSQKINRKDYSGLEGFLNYADDYDNLVYSDVYNYLLDFEVENKLKI